MACLPAVALDTVREGEWAMIHRAAPIGDCGIRGENCGQ